MDWAYILGDWIKYVLLVGLLGALLLSKWWLFAIIALIFLVWFVKSRINMYRIK